MSQKVYVAQHFNSLMCQSSVSFCRMFSPCHQPMAAILSPKCTMMSFRCASCLIRPRELSLAMIPCWTSLSHVGTALCVARLARPGSHNSCLWQEGQSLCDQPSLQHCEQSVGKVRPCTESRSQHCGCLQARYGSNTGGIILLVPTAVAMFNCATVSLSVNSR